MIRVRKGRPEEHALFVLIGVCSALVCTFYAELFSLTEDLSVKVFSKNPALLFVIAPLGLLTSHWLVRRFAPGSGGSGIPQVLACIQDASGELSKNLLRKSVVVVKILSSLVAVFAGAAIGREGPSLQISAAIARNLGALASRVRVSMKAEQLLVAGAASGLAAAFNTPIGGIVYAIEELSREHVRTFRDVLLLSVVIAGLTAQLAAGNYLYLGYPRVPKLYGFTLILVAGGLGFACGVLGGCFSKLLAWLTRWHEGNALSTQLLTVAGVGVVLAASFLYLGGPSLYSGKEVINQTLFSTEPVGIPLALARFLTPLLSSITGIAGGVFAPSLSAGAAVGSFTASLLGSEFGTVFALTGMVGFLTGVTHTPITSFILVLEMTDRHSVVLPMMVAAVFSSLGARLVSEKSFYEVRLERFAAPRS